MELKKLAAACCSLTMLVSFSVLSPLAVAAPGERGATDNPRVKVNRMFNVLDTDLSETITLDEWLARVSDRASNQFERIDTDDDALISLDEFLARGGQRGPDDVDRDAVRACVEAELGEALPERPDRASTFAEWDTNDDGFFDIDEYLAAKTESATARFLAIDVDDDGAITRTELGAALTQHHDRRAIRRNCVDDQRDAEALLAG